MLFFAVAAVVTFHNILPCDCIIIGQRKKNSVL